jgi:two-component system invasion response regulator UvrY
MGTAAYRSRLSVLVVDDHVMIRRGIASMLAGIPGVQLVGEAANGEEALRLARELAPDVVLMDLRMPGIGGLEAARRIHAALPRTRIVGVTAWENEPIRRLHRCGFSACLGKNIDAATLEAVIRRVTGQAAEAVGEPQPRASDNPFDALTSREMQVTSLLLEGQRAPQIARRLFITPKTVHTYRYRIFEKLGVAGDIELTKLATSHGLIGP